MVLGRPPQGVPSLVVPDELALTVWGHDPYACGLAPIAACGAARALLSAEPLPASLRAALAELQAALPHGASRQTATISGPAAAIERAASGGSPARQMRDGEHRRGHQQAPDDPRGLDPHAAHGHHDGAGDAERPENGQGGHDHHDMMATTGEPSADGLVMEPIQLSYGPLLTPLPGGVLCELDLDGDVVSPARREQPCRSRRPRAPRWSPIHSPRRGRRCSKPAAFAVVIAVQRERRRSTSPPSAASGARRR